MIIILVQKYLIYNGYFWYSQSIDITFNYFSDYFPDCKHCQSDMHHVLGMLLSSCNLHLNEEGFSSYCTNVRFRKWDVVHTIIWCSLYPCISIRHGSRSINFLYIFQSSFLSLCAVFHFLYHSLNLIQIK